MSLNILIIDDEITDRMAVKRAFAYLDNMSAFEAEEGQEGLDKIKQRSFDAVFLDYRLPDMSGIDVLKKLYDPDTGMMPCPVIMMTGQSDEALMVEALRYGAHDYVPKDLLSTDALRVALIKAREMHELKKSRNAVEERLVQSQKMEIVGQLTGGVAHDFNNLLTIIFGNLQLLAMKLGRKDPDFEGHLQKVEAIHRTAERGADLVRHMMIFSRQRSLSPEITDVNALLEELEDPLQRAIGEMITLETILAPDLWSVSIDPVMLQNVLINMAVNARDAMKDGGALTLETENITVDEDDNTHGSDVEPGDYVALSVSDTGIGIPEEDKQKIFEPFFTTKDVGKGTGLGLSMVYGFIKDSGGSICVDSAQGEGTCFLIYLPKAGEHEKQVAKEETEEAEVKGGDEIILLVEDEDEIRALTMGLLEERGYTVITAPDGPQAVDILKNKEQHIDLLFTDIVMPNEMNGVQLAATAQSIRPEIKFVFTTGYAGDSAPDLHLAQRYTVIDKPYKTAVMLRTIRRILDNEMEE